MIDYTIKDGKLAIDPATLTVQAFNAIWEFDTSRTKSKASNILTYVFTLCDERERNPFKDVEHHRKEAACKKNAFGNPDHKFNPEEQQLVDDAIQWFEFLNSSSIQRLSRGIDRTIDNMAKFLEDHEITNMTQYKAASDELKKVESIIKSKISADKLMREEMGKAKTKGGQQRSLVSRKLI